MNIGTKIRKMRELKGFSQENMAKELNLSVSGYGRIERNEVNINHEKLNKIAEIMDTDINNILNFDDKTAFNIHNYSNTIERQITQNFFPAELKQLYEDKIKLLEEKIAWLEEKNNTSK